MNNLWWPTSGAVLTSYSPKSCCSEVLFALKADLVKYISYIHHGDLNTGIGVTEWYYKRMQHGKNSSYTKGACRCTECRSAHATYMREYYATRNGRAAVERARVKYEKNHPDRRAAYTAIGSALRSGKLIKPPECEHCGKTTSKLDGSHDDYSKPLEVEWLCRPCHMQKDLPQFA
jgi:hypothetical protein